MSPSTPRLLAVLAPSPRAEALARLLASLPAFAVTRVEALQAARAHIAAAPVELVLTDRELPDGSGLELIGPSETSYPFPVVVLDDGGGQLRPSLEAMRAGAADCLLPADLDPVHIPERLLRILEEWRQRRQRLQRAEAFHQEQQEILEMVARGAPLNDTLERLVRALEHEAEGMLGSILILDKPGRCLRHGAAPSLPADFNRIVEGIEIGPDEGSCGATAFHGEAVFANEIATDSRWTKYRHIAAHFDLAACWSTPVFSYKQELLGTFAMYYRQPRRPTAEELRLIAVATRIAGIAIERSLGRAEVERAHRQILNTMESMNDGFVIYDQEWRFVYINPVLEHMLGVHRGELVGKNQWEVHPFMLGTEFERHYRQAMATRRPEEFVYHHLAATRELNPWYGRWYAYRLYPVDEGGLSVSVRDITESRQIEEQLQQARKMEAIGQLAGGIAHDFNNLLTVINGYARLLMDQLALEASEETKWKAAEQILAAGERAAILTRQLLQFSRKQTVRGEILDLNAAVRNIAEMIRRLIGENIALTLHLAPSLPAIHADPGMVEQVVLNLAINARDAMPRGGEITVSTDTVEIEDEATRARLQAPLSAAPGPYVCLHMSDTGVGIAAEALAHLFEPFFTTKAPGKGTGLGLATVFGIARQHRGWVAASSRPGAGASFQVYWPAAPSPPAGKQA